MKKAVTIILSALILCACSPSAESIQTAIAQTQAAITFTQTSIPTETLTPTLTATATQISSPTLEVTPTATLNPCLLWNQVTLEMAGQTICVRGIIRRIDISRQGSHWDFTDNRTGFFAVSKYLGWHPITGKDMSVGDCVTITGAIQVLSNSRPYIYWGAKSIFKSAVKGTGGYYEHPDLQVIENNPSFCQ